jgi:hypothetical protein
MVDNTHMAMLVIFACIILIKIIKDEDRRR